MSRKNFKKLKNAPGIYKNPATGNFFVEKRIKGKLHTESFTSLFEAKKWRQEFDGLSQVTKETPISQHSTLKEVWDVMQEKHFPNLAYSTKDIWKRRYELWKIVEHLPMDKVTPSKVTSWVNHWVDHFKSDDYQNSGRGRAGRCNLNNELNMFVTIFNWYKESEQFEREAISLTCPIKRKHRALGFIKPLPTKKKQISLEDAFLFFQYLKPLYRELAMIQFYIAGRVGETAGLQWSNIDIKNKRMIVKETCVWDTGNKTFKELKAFPKNKEPRVCFISDEILEILQRREAFKLPGCNYVFHVEGKPLNYCTIQVNYRDAQRKSGVPYSGTHILRHGMAKLARKIGGGLDAVIAMTGHKDIKLADHYSKCDEDDQRQISEKVMKHIRNYNNNPESDNEESKQVISLFGYKKANNQC